MTLQSTEPLRHYTGSSSTFSKRQCRPEEQTLKDNGEVVTYPFTRQRLENEGGALRFIAQNTNIPVPRVIELVRHRWHRFAHSRDRPRPICRRHHLHYQRG